MGRINHTRKALRVYRNVLLQSPTGSGKTAIATYMLQNVAAKGNVGFFICHRQELVDQTSKTFTKFGLDHGFIASGYPVNYFKKIQVCSIDTLKNRLKYIPNPAVCIWDEAHHLRAAGWVRVHDFFDSSYHIGLSATPQRLDGKGLDDRFDYLVPGPSPAWLIEQGHLAKYKLYSVPGCDLSGVNVNVESQAAAAMDKPTITGNIVAHWRKLASDRLTIGFAASRKMSEKYAAFMRAAGIPSVHLDGETPKDERRDLLRKFALGEIRVIWNVGLFGEGFDISANSGIDVTVGCVIDAAPTNSLSSWLQRCGRALRPQDGYAIIIDHAGNSRHGLPCEDRKWTLNGVEKDEREDGEKRSNKQCEECFHFHKPAPKCPECGFVYPVQHRVIDEVDGELEEIDPQQVRAQTLAEQAQAKTIEQLQEIEKQRGHKEGWAEHVERARREKKALREELFNLAIGAGLAGVNLGFEKSEIKKMKPKQLREHISHLTEEIKKQPQFG